MTFNHENLDVYKAAIEFLALAFQRIEKMPKGYGFLIDQLKRACLSIPLNIAEGNGKYSKQEKARYYKISRASANECSAILDAAEIVKIIDKSERDQGKALLYRIVCMLSKMII